MVCHSFPAERRSVKFGACMNFRKYFAGTLGLMALSDVLDAPVLGVCAFLLGILGVVDVLTSLNVPALRSTTRHGRRFRQMRATPLHQLRSPDRWPAIRAQLRRNDRLRHGIHARSPRRWR